MLPHKISSLSLEELRRLFLEYISDCSITYSMWFHAAVLDLFRPFSGMPTQMKRSLRTFTSSNSSIEAVCRSSINQLKQLIFIYYRRHKFSVHTVLWHTALVYVANAVLRDTTDEAWNSFFLVCLYGYEGLRRSWRVAEIITKGLLSMALRNGNITTALARRILDKVQMSNLTDVESELRGTFMVDLDLSMSDPRSATVDEIAGAFEANALLRDCTTIFDDST